MTIKNTSKLLFNEEPITINRLGAKVLGLNEAIVIQQIHYWLEINRKAKINFHDGRTWTYNTYEKWQGENFDFWSLATLKRIFKKLFDEKILLKGNYNTYKYDRTLWVTINYDKLDEILNSFEQKQDENIEISTKCQFDTMESVNLTQCKVSNCDYGKCQSDTMESVNLTLTIPETTTETTTEISTTESKQNVSVVNTNKELIESKTHLILDSKYKKDKVINWKKDRLEKSINIFLEQKGTYFSLLEKIYKDDKNFIEEFYTEGKKETVIAKQKQDYEMRARKNKFHNTNASFINYTPEELERHLQESQKGKFTCNAPSDTKFNYDDCPF